MRPAFCAGLIALFFAPVLSAQDMQEFIIIATRGDVRTYRLPTNWVARIEEAYLLLGDGNRLRAQNVAAVKPRSTGPVAGYHEVEITFPTISGKSLSQIFWLPNAYGTLADVPVKNGFHRIDERTIVRVGIKVP